MFGQTILYLYHVTTAVTADVCHVNVTKHGSDLSIVGIAMLHSFHVNCL